MKTFQLPQKAQICTYILRRERRTLIEKIADSSTAEELNTHAGCFHLTLQCRGLMCAAHPATQSNREATVDFQRGREMKSFQPQQHQHRPQMPPAQDFPCFLPQLPREG